MSVVQVERPAAPAPAPRTWTRWVDTALRVLLLAILLASWASALPSWTAKERPVRQFVRDLGVDRVTSIEYLDQSRELRWTNGGLHWYQASLAVSLPPPPPSDDLTVYGSSGDVNKAADRAWLARTLQAVHREPMSYREVDSSEKLAWTDEVPWHGLSKAAALTVCVAFFMMLWRDRRRFASRWGWFWVFVVVGNGVGPFLFLVLEPSPLWQRDGLRPFPERPAFRGGMGLVVALGLKLVLAVAVGIALNQLR
jgi:hypothetical protein